jgi:hypothetical protein
LPIESYYFSGFVDGDREFTEVVNQYEEFAELLLLIPTVIVWVGLAGDGGFHARLRPPMAMKLLAVFGPGFDIRYMQHADTYPSSVALGIRVSRLSVPYEEILFAVS